MTGYQSVEKLPKFTTARVFHSSWVSNFHSRTWLHER